VVTTLMNICTKVYDKISDSTNIGDAMGVIPFTWSLGITIGLAFIVELIRCTLTRWFFRPIIGGLLAEPAVQWPDTLGHIRYLKTHPFFLPCAVVAFLSFAICIVTFIGLKEVRFI